MKCQCYAVSRDVQIFATLKQGNLHPIATGWNFDEPIIVTDLHLCDSRSDNTQTTGQLYITERS